MTGCDLVGISISTQAGSGWYVLIAAKVETGRAGEWPIGADCASQGRCGGRGELGCGEVVLVLQGISGQSMPCTLHGEYGYAFFVQPYSP